ncbi:type VII secretion protein EccE [Streptomyces litchfieldiae]|uniref:Type VII secretion protein EccE n=1 Tax=Streptomyces litchfieldiae TaxID=3075543 RepID=A0ABU2MIN2_9ACTN|nr:type VII secretion protein EccE [Streptomyces sp. DSM 44938]MDT0341292.1 type VII secretion protein EccE [Streptomyces sp. DSM 44938]
MGSGAAQAGRARSRRERFRRVRFGRARLVAVEAGLGGVAAGLAVRTAWGGWGYVLVGAGVLLAVGSLVRFRGDWADRRVLARLRRGQLAVTPPGSGGPDGDLGVAQTLLPALSVTEVADRNVPARRGHSLPDSEEPAGALGVVSDGRGHAAVAAFPGGVLPALPAEIVARWLAEDPARPAAAQVVVEQFGVPSWDFHHRFRPTVVYRQLPAGDRPVAVRSWLVVRYEPLDAPEATVRRGGGEDGARAAVVAAAARLRALLAAHGAPTTPLDAAEARQLLRQLGDPQPGGTARSSSWAGAAATHATLTASVTSQSDWHHLLSGMSGCTADRVVAAATLTAGPTAPGEGPGLCVRAAVRVVSPLAQHATAQRDRLEAAGVAGPPATDQAAGLLATLPLAYPSRSLDEATGFATPGDR